MTHEAKRFSTPLSVCIAFCMFLAVLAELLFIAVPMQTKFGMAGLALTEAMLLVTAVAGCFIFRQRVREMFPVRVPLVRDFFGVPLLWAGVLLISLVCVMIIGCFFPEGLLNTSGGLTAFFKQTPTGLTLLIAALLPAICEEAVFRGFILHFFKPLGKRWLVIVLVGILFGAVHLDPYRFLPTALLGGAIAYVALQTDNLLLCALMHFINNLPAALTARFAPTEAASEIMSAEGVSAQNVLSIAFSPMTVGGMLLLAIPAPWLILMGTALLRHTSEKDTHLTAKIVVSSVASALMLVAGFALIVIGAIQFPELLENQNLL